MATRKSMVLLGLLAAALLLVGLALPVAAGSAAPAGITDTPIPTDTPTMTPTVAPEVPVVPEASTLVLLGSSAAGLAAYVGLQIRARRKS